MRSDSGHTGPADPPFETGNYTVDNGMGGQGIGPFQSTGEPFGGSRVLQLAVRWQF